MEGFQLWLNLAGKDKMRAPWYRDFNGDEAVDGADVTLIERVVPRPGD